VTAVVSYFTYHCNDGYCNSDNTPEGLHIRWVLKPEKGKARTFNFRADLDRYASENSITLEQKVTCQQPT
jgi:hypothetical protein